MKRISRIKQGTILTACLVMMAALSWYGTDAKTISPQDEKEGSKKDYFTVVNLHLKDVDRMSVNGKDASWDQCIQLLTRLSEDKEDIIIGINTEPDVTMGFISDLQKELSRHDLTKVAYTSRQGEQFRLTLPPDMREKLENVRPEDIMKIVLNKEGDIYVDGEPVSGPVLGDLIRERLEGNQLLVVSIQPHEDARFHDYVHVLNVVKTAGATRISMGVVVNEPSGKK